MAVHLDSSAGDDDNAEAMSDINVTPFIDVMLVLLIIFMVTAPLMMGGVRVNLPRTSGTPMPRPDSPLIVSLDANNQIFVDKDLLSPELMRERFRALALESESGEVFVRGDGEVKYAKVMDLMSELGQAGFARVTLVTNVQTGPAPPGEGEAPMEGGVPADSASGPAGAAPAPVAAPAAPPTAAPAPPPPAPKDAAEPPALL
jgi:biopolymer transport protein ExbD